MNEINKEVTAFYVAVIKKTNYRPPCLKAVALFFAPKIQENNSRDYPAKTRSIHTASVACLLIFDIFKQGRETIEARIYDYWRKQ